MHKKMAMSQFQAVYQHFHQGPIEHNEELQFIKTGTESGPPKYKA